MKKLLVLLVLTPIILFSQERISQDIGSFNKLKTFSGLKVKLIKGNTNKIEIKGNNSENVVVKNVDGLLKLSVTLPNAFDEDKTLIKLYFTDDLELIDANEGSAITSEDELLQEFLTLRTQEGATIELRVQVLKLKIKAVTGGVVSLAGKVQSQNVIINTGGIYEGFDLQSQNATVAAATGGEAEVNVIDLLDAKVKLQGFIVYKAKPKNLKKKKLLGGVVCSVDDYHNEGGERVYN